MTIECGAPVNWQAPTGVNAWFSWRSGGTSRQPFATLNLAEHVGDEAAAVAENRHRFATASGAPVPVHWLEQVHGSDIVTPTDGIGRADGWYSRNRGESLAIMVADCLPVLLAAADGTAIAALHAGWRGLAGDIIAKGVARFAGEDLVAWLGPAIGPCHYEVDAPVRMALADYADCFTPVDEAHWRLNLQQVAEQQLRELGVSAISRDSDCTFCESARYFSARRDVNCGRMAVLVWRE